MTRGWFVLFIGILVIVFIFGGVGLLMHLSNDFSWLELAKGLGVAIIVLFIMKLLFKKVEKLYQIELNI
ncbi:MAG: hypothetical protein WC575_02890 [Patescibacteria group bacterium]